MPIDPNNISLHVLEDRMQRYSFIRNSIGFGECIAISIACDRFDKSKIITKTLTSTGVIVIRDFHNTIITTYIADLGQAKRLYFEATKSTIMPRNLWLTINYNNNTKLWHKVVA